MRFLALLFSVFLLCPPVLSQEGETKSTKPEETKEEKPLTGKEIVALFTEKAEDLFKGYISILPYKDNPVYEAETRAVPTLKGVIKSGVEAKYHYFTTIYYDKPTTYSIDVQRTDSLISPFVGWLIIPVSLNVEKIIVKTKRKGLCGDLTPEGCMKQFGGNIIIRQTNEVIVQRILSREEVRRIEGRKEPDIRVNYAFQDGAWVQKNVENDPLSTIKKELKRPLE